jgi:hypothetical protein
LTRVPTSTSPSTDVDRRRAARARVLRGIVLLAASPLAFRAGVWLALFPALAVLSVVAFFCSYAGTKDVVLGAFELSDAKRARADAQLPEARALPPRADGE